MATTKPTLVFTTGLDWFSILVNVGTFNRASHVAIGLGDQLLHVHEGGVVLEPKESWLVHKRQKLVAEIEIVPNVAPGLQRCLSKLGQPYDHIGVVRAALWIALQRMASPIWTAGPPSRSAYTCASFVMLLDPDGDRIPEWKRLQRSVVTPADLLHATEHSFRNVQPPPELW